MINKQIFQLLLLVAITGRLHAQQVVEEWVAVRPDTSATTSIDATLRETSVYICYTKSTLGISYLSLLKYDLEGQLVWQRSVPDTFLYSTGQRMECDDLENIYISGAWDFWGGFMVKYDSSGNLLWTDTLNGIIRDQAIDEDNNFYVLIEGFPEEGAALRKYNNNGNLVWHLPDSLVTGVGLYPRKLIVNAETIYVLGTRYDSLLGIPSQRPYITKLDTSGTILWEYNDQGSFRYFANDMDLNVSDFNLYFIGVGFESDVGCVITKIDSQGNYDWHMIYDTLGMDLAHKVQCNETGNPYIYYFTNDNTTSSIISLDSAGNENWVVEYDSSNGGLFGDFVLDQYGSIFITCKASEPATGTGVNFGTAKFDENGNKVWGMNYGSVALQQDRSQRIMLDPNNNLYVAGVSTTKNFPTLIKYSQVDGIDSDKMNVETAFSVYPNPCSSILTVEASNNIHSDIKIIFLNILGEKVSEAVIASRESNINCQELTSGIYFYCIQGNQGEVIQTGKIIIQ